MSQLRVAPIVEGHGDAVAIRTLLDRVWRELLHGVYIDVLRPFRCSRSKLIRPAPDQSGQFVRGQELSRAVQLVMHKLQAKPPIDSPSMILILVDADADCPAEIGPELTRIARETAGTMDVCCVLAKVEYETWFVASAESLTDFLKLASNELPIDDPEGSQCGKRWIQERFRGYSEPVDQVRMTAKMDLDLCRSRSPSFDKLCRELQSRM